MEKKINRGVIRTGETDIKVHLIDCDCAFTWFLNEVTLEDGELVFNCTNGYVSIKAKEIKLGIPTQQVDK